MGPFMLTLTFNLKSFRNHCSNILTKITHLRQISQEHFNIHISHSGIFNKKEQQQKGPFMLTSTLYLEVIQTPMFQYFDENHISKTSQ